MSAHQSAFDAAAGQEDYNTHFERIHGACLSYRYSLTVMPIPGGRDERLTVIKLYDFIDRSVTTVTRDSTGKIVTQPPQSFQEVDTETLGFMHGKLIALHGNPPPLEKNRATDKGRTPNVTR